MGMRVKPCGVSGCIETGRLRCSICKVWYCCQQCQQEDWPGHRRFCEKPPPLEWPPVATTRTGPQSGGDQEKSLEQYKNIVKIPIVKYKKAVISSEMAIKYPEKKKRYAIVPLEYFESPSEFAVRLELEVS